MKNFNTEEIAIIYYILEKEIKDWRSELIKHPITPNQVKAKRVAENKISELRVVSKKVLENL